MRKRARIGARDESAPSSERAVPSRRSTSGLTDALLRLQRAAGNRATSALAVQAKLTVGRDNDPLEREADAVAHHVLRAMQAPAQGAAPALTEEADAPAVHRKSGSGPDPLGGLPVDAGLEAEIDRGRSGGQPVPAAVRQAAETAMGTDLSAVRVHSDANADALSRSLQAKAFTTGNDIFFRKGGYDPSSSAGREVLAHELAHVAQQGGTARRRLDFDGNSLDGLVSIKGQFNRSALTHILATYQKYVAVADRDPTSEVKYLSRLKAELNTWAHKRSAKGATKKEDLSDNDRTKFDALDLLMTAVKAELPLVQKRLARENNMQGAFTRLAALGLPVTMIDELSDKDVVRLAKADMFLSAGRVSEADLEIQSITGEPALPLIKSMLFRRHLGALNLGGLDAVYNDPKYQLKDQAEIAAGAQQTQAYATARAAELDPSSTEAELHLPILNDLSAAAAKKLTDAPQELTSMTDTVQSYPTVHYAPYLKYYAKSVKGLGKLTNEEAGAILGYSTNLYPKFNKPLRGDLNRLLGGEAASTKLAVSGLNKLPAFTGTVYRHGQNFPGYAKVNRVGAVVVDMAFLSSAVSQQSCVSAAEHHEVLEVLTSKTGRNIALMSAFGVGEAEVLFRPGTRFKVTRVEVSPRWQAETAKLVAETKYEDRIGLVVYKEEV